MTDAELKRTPLHDAHVSAGGRIVPFAGYQMPVQYSGPDGGVLAEHRWTREHAGLFDVSHMGQAYLDGPDALGAFERLVSGEFQSLKVGRQKYSLLMAEDGGVLDDLMAARPDDGGLFVVVNASRKDEDFALMAAELAREGVTVNRLDDRALLALQGPEAAEVLAKHAPEVADMGFMDSRTVPLFGTEAIVSRSGYTGEDGYEISLPGDKAAEAWDALLADAKVRPIGLGARDSLRLEAGLPLYGHDVDETTSPFEAALDFAVSKKRLAAGSLRGADRLTGERDGGMSRVRVGLRLTGAPAREGAEIADLDGAVIGRITSGGPSPTLGSPVAMGYVPPAHAAPGTALQVLVRGRAVPAEVVFTPFVPHRYHRKTKIA